MMQTIFRTKSEKPKGILYKERLQYQEAWERLERLSNRLPKLWKGKKTSLEVLKEERSQ